MKTTITLLSFFIWTLTFYAQTDKIILDIDQATNEIKSKISSFRKIEKINNSEGSRFVFLKDKELQLITVQQIGPDVEKNVEWYYINGVLTYSETKWLDKKSQQIVFNEKEYLRNGHLIAWINSENKLVDSTRLEFKTIDTALAAYGIEIKNEALK